MNGGDPLRRLGRRFDAELLSLRSLDGNGFRLESETRDVTGHCDFDVQLAQHVLTLTPDGRPTQIERRVDGGPLERFVMGSGVLTLLPAGQRSRGYTQGLGSRGEMLLFLEPELVARATGADIDPSRLALVQSADLRSPSLLHAMAALRREVKQPGPMGGLYAESLVLVALTELVRHHSTLAVSPKRDEDLVSHRLRRVIDYMDAHLGEDLSLLTLAAEADMSPAHFARGFKRATRQSVHQYLLGRRFERAAALLGGTEQSIAEVALATGFCSQSHLTTAFQRPYGMTPAAYRRQRRR